MTEILSFAQKPRMAMASRGRVIVVDPTIFEVLMETADGKRTSGVVDPRDLSDQLYRIVHSYDRAVWVECEMVQTVVTQFFLMADHDALDTCLQQGDWSIEEDVITLCRNVWREARVPYTPPTVERKIAAESTASSSSPELWRNLDLFPHQRKTVTWMKCMEASFPQCIPYSGNLRFTDKWYLDTESECFTTDASPRQAHLVGGVCADGMGKGKTASVLRLIAETKRAPARDMYESQATLVILPLNLVGQWKGEMEKFLCTESMRILFVVQGKDIPNMDAVLQADVVVTTFHFLRNNKTYSDTVDRLLVRRPRERASLSAWARVKGHTECILEAVHWRRVVIDEIHQTFERIGDMRHCKLIRSGAIWGLTATPTLDTDQAQHLYSLLSREKTHHPNLLSRLIGSCVRNHAVDDATSGEKRSLHMVSLSAEERVLLGDIGHYSLADKIRKATFVDCGIGKGETDETTETTHFAGIHSQVFSSRKREFDAIRSRVAGHERSVRMLEHTERELRQEYERIRSSAPNSEEERTAATALAQHVEDTNAARNLLNRQNYRLQQKQMALETIQQRIRQIPEEAICDSCGAQVNLWMLTDCMHILCRGCLGGGMQTVCVKCGESIEDIVKIDTTKGVGTKMREIATLLQEVGEVKPVILFVQWKSMVRGTRSFLKSCGIAVHSLDGNSSQRTHTLRSLTQGGVLLLCLEDGFAGLHLPHVSHIVFAHAIVGNRDRVLTLEAQAIARCCRYGQTKDVNTYSFVVADTEESVLYEQTHEAEA